MYNITQFSKKIGFSVKTLQRWDREGILKPHTRTKTNRRLYSQKQLDDFTKSPKSKRKIISYCRVSSHNQKKDLESQKSFIIDYCKNAGIIIDKFYQDIGSGLNFKRKNFLKLIEDINNSKISMLILAHKDRLCRFGFELIEYLCEENNVEIKILNDERLSPEQELCQDLTSIIHVFSSRLYGLRKYKKEFKNICDGKK